MKNLNIFSAFKPNESFFQYPLTLGSEPGVLPLEDVCLDPAGDLE